jgi:hypothetical protein
VRTTRFLGGGEGDESLARQAAIGLKDELNALGTQAETCRGKRLVSDKKMLIP